MAFATFRGAGPAILPLHRERKTITKAPIRPEAETKAKLMRRLRIQALTRPRATPKSARMPRWRNW
ncbi:hypothetical protein HOE425_333350 [Hoeflea sp. EC-HK425]|nr:hypothetical protein HOE425_333350 [Hoeflea sp. EC-HK425]